MNIIVVMSTFNGEKYIEAQLESILNQTLSCKILIRDDGSKDSTLAILKSYASRFPQIHLLDDNIAHLGIQESYTTLFQSALGFSPDYILYSDQDDIWLPQKIDKLIAAISPLEKYQKPALVFSDTQVVDTNLNLIHASYVDLQKLTGIDIVTFKKLLLFCPALGCTMIFNKQLLELATITPSTMINPDKWILFIAVSTGHVGYLPETTLLYRQHGANVEGAMRGIKRKIWKFANIQFIRDRYQTALDQASDVEKKLPYLNRQQKLVLQQFILLFGGSRLERFIAYFHFFKAVPHWKRKLGLFLTLFFKFKTI